MTDLPKMTEAQAYLYLDFVGWRLLGWNTVDRMKHHPNSNACKAVDKRFRDTIGAQPSVDAFVGAAMTGGPVHLLWPEHLQDEVECQINTKVPRAASEPTSEEFAIGMSDGGRDWVLPEFLINHGSEPAEGTAA